MRRIFACLAALVSLVGCSSGQPASIERGAARQSVAPVSALGFRPEVQATLAIPIDTAACVTGTATKVLVDLIDGARCVLNTLVPIVTPPAPSAAAASAGCVEETTTVTTKRVVPAAAPASRATNCPEPPPAPIACAGGTCGLPR